MSVSVKVLEARSKSLPPNSIKVSDKNSSAVVYLYERNGNLCSVGFRGRKTKPEFRYRFSDVNERNVTISKFFQNNQKTEEILGIKKDGVNGYKVGEILYASWGYEQTNIDFYEVVGTTEKSVYLRPIASETVEVTGFMSGRKMPVVGKFIGEKFRCISRGRSSIRINGYKYASLWDGKSKDYSSYA